MRHEKEVDPFDLTDGSSTPPIDAKVSREKAGNSAAKKPPYRNGSDEGRERPAPETATSIAERIATVDAATARGTLEPEPVDFFAAFNPAPIPRETLPPVIADFVADRSDIIGTDPAVVAMGCLVAAAAAIHDGFQIQPKKHDTTWTESARLWGAVVGRPSAKKTPGLAQAIRTVKRIDMEFSDQGDADMARYSLLRAEYEQKVKAAAKAGTTADLEPEPERPMQRRAIVEDATIEALAPILADNPGGLLSFHDELSGFFGGMDAYRQNGANKDRAHWLEAYNGGPRVIDRVGKGKTSVRNWSLCLLGGIQPARMQEVAKNIADDGLLQRFMVVMADNAGEGKDRKADLDAINAWRDLLRKLHHMVPPDGAVFVLNDEAIEVRERVSRFAHAAVLSDGISDSFSSHMGKWDGLFARLLLLFHVTTAASATGKEAGFPEREIGLDVALNVERFMVCFLYSHATHFYTEILGKAPELDRATKVATYILTAKLEQVSVRVLNQSVRCMKGTSSQECRAVMDRLVNFGWVEPIIIESRMDCTRWNVYPAVHEKFAERAVTARKERDLRLAAMQIAFAERRK